MKFWKTSKNLIEIMLTFFHLRFLTRVHTGRLCLFCSFDVRSLSVKVLSFLSPLLEFLLRDSEHGIRRHVFYHYGLSRKR